MFSLEKNFYAAWREKSVGNFLRDENSLPAEKLLQAIWQNQRLQRDQLKTGDGKSLRVFHPGFASLEGGPDFRGAVLQFENETPTSGDVEIDLQTGGWHAHGHDQNPNFKNVLLHVVWEEKVQPPSRRSDALARREDGSSKSNVQSRPKILALKNYLDAPFAELNSVLENESLRLLPENLRGKCCAPLRELSETQLTRLLQQTAQVRFENKAAQFRARAKNVGWEQTLWENLFRALGYKNNVWPMQTLAEAKSQWSRGANSVFEFQARLLGVSGLLPAELSRAEKSSDNYLRRVWDFWWRERDAFADFILPRAIWKFHGLRPANHPQRRLALAAHWLTDKNFISKIEGWIAAEISEKNLINSLHEIFQVESDEFWSWHWTFKSARLKKAQTLLGAARVTDLAVNVILPWLWIRAREGENAKIQREVERRFLAWPAAEDNSILKLARQRLLGEGRRVGDLENFGTVTRRPSQILSCAAAQQGLLQIVRDFCEHSNAICTNCDFPQLVKSWQLEF